MSKIRPAWRIFPLAALFACADLISAPEGANVILPAAAELLVMVRGVGDATARITPALGSGSRASELRSALSALESALVAADPQAVGSALSRTKTAFDLFVSSEMSPDQAPDASNIELVLFFVEGSIQRPCSAPQPAAAVSSFASCTGR